MEKEFLYSRQELTLLRSQNESTKTSTRKPRESITKRTQYIRWAGPTLLPKQKKATAVKLDLAEF